LTVNTPEDNVTTIFPPMRSGYLIIEIHDFATPAGTSCALSGSPINNARFMPVTRWYVNWFEAHWIVGDRTEIDVSKTLRKSKKFASVYGEQKAGQPQL